MNPGAVVERCSDAGFLSHFDLPLLPPSLSPTMQGLSFQCRMYRLHLQRPPRSVLMPRSNCHALLLSGGGTRGRLPAMAA